VKLAKKRAKLAQKGVKKGVNYRNKKRDGKIKNSMKKIRKTPRPKGSFAV